MHRCSHCSGKDHKHYELHHRHKLPTDRRPTKEVLLSEMRCSIFRGTYPPLLFLAIGFIATTTALVIRDHPFDTANLEHVPIDGGRFSENCNNFDFNDKTCVLTATCKPKSDTKDASNVKDNRRTSSLNLNKCFWYHKVDKKENDLGWQVDWNEKNEDRHGITNFCDFCDTTLGPRNTYEVNPLVLWPMCLPPDDPKDTYRRLGTFHTWLDRYIANDDG